MCSASRHSLFIDILNSLLLNVMQSYPTDDNYLLKPQLIHNVTAAGCMFMKQPTATRWATAGTIWHRHCSFDIAGMLTSLPSASAVVKRSGRSDVDVCFELRLNNSLVTPINSALSFSRLFHHQTAPPQQPSTEPCHPGTKTRHFITTFL